MDLYIMNGEDNAYLLLGVCISRSATCPLWLDLDLDDDLFYSNPAYSYLLSISSRIQRLRVSTNNLRLLERSEFRHFADGLATLVHTDLSMETNVLFSSGTLSLPHTLQHLVITPYAAFSNRGVDFNWSRLESLVLRARYLGRGDVPIRSTLVILAKVHNLRRLTFSDDGEVGSVLAKDGTCATDPGLITIAHLTDLVIESCTPSLYDVLADVSAPSLERMVIKGCLPETLLHVGGMLKRSGCTLRHLTLQTLGDEHGAVNTIDVVDSLLRQCSLLGSYPSLASVLVQDSLPGLSLNSFFPP
ncbi:hypothetical protein BDZ89DRAFT_1201961 [Hymenopellis radicata]|nr:hypothetical protein BDZ89DRAFT_1201961 [Hymenopellis radicata]